MAEKKDKRGKLQHQGGDQFPDVSDQRGSRSFVDCILQCTCEECTRGEAVKLLCQPYGFGEVNGKKYQILVHEFTWDGETWAVILQHAENPEEYYLWATYTSNGGPGIYPHIVLEEVPAMSPEIASPEYEPQVRAPDRWVKRPIGDDGGEVSKRMRTRGSGVFVPPFANIPFRPSQSVEHFLQGLCDAIGDSAGRFREDISPQSSAASGNSDALAVTIAQNQEPTMSEPGTSQESTPSIEQEVVPDSLNSNDGQPTSDVDMQQSTASVQPPALPNLNQTYCQLGQHLARLRDRNGHPILSSNSDLIEHLEDLKNLVNVNMVDPSRRGFLFREYCEMIDDDLESAGYPKLSLV